jgi:hypothetical protein
LRIFTSKIGTGEGTFILIRATGDAVTNIVSPAGAGETSNSVAASRKRVTVSPPRLSTLIPVNTTRARVDVLLPLATNIVLVGEIFVINRISRRLPLAIDAHVHIWATRHGVTGGPVDIGWVFSLNVSGVGRAGSGKLGRLDSGRASGSPLPHST